MDYTAGKGTTALGIIGTTLGGIAVAGSGVVKALTGNGESGRPTDHHAHMRETELVSKYEAAQAEEINRLRTEKMLLESTIHANNNQLELYKYIDGELKDIRSELCKQAVHNQRTEDSFVVARQDLAAVKNELSAAIAMEAERRCCADNSIVNYANATFYSRLIADVTAATTTTAQATFNPIPNCGCCKNS